MSALQISKFEKSFNVCSNSKRLTTCMVKKIKSHTLQKQKLISITIFFLIFAITPNPTPRCITILLIIYFYLIDITYKYNKLLLI